MYLKKSPISWSWRADKAEDYAQGVTVKVAELQRRRNSYLRLVSYANIGLLVREDNPTWDKHICVDVLEPPDNPELSGLAEMAG